MAKSLEVLAGQTTGTPSATGSTPVGERSRAAARELSEAVATFERRQLRPWVGWVTGLLLVGFVAYAIYFGEFVFPTNLILTEPILGWIFFALLFANFVWMLLLGLVNSGEEAEEREYVLNQIRELQRDRESEL